MKEKWMHEYINDVDISKIEWIKLDANELKQFLFDNYFDNEEYKYVCDGNIHYDTPFGLHYLTFDATKTCPDCKFILGIVNNNIGKKTIVADLIYMDSDYFFTKQTKTFTSFISVEINYYFQNKGIYKRFCDEIIKFIPLNQHILVSSESELGRLCHTTELLKTSLIKKGFDKEIFSESFPTESCHNFNRGITRMLRKRNETL